MAIIEATNISKAYPVRSGARALLGRGGLTSLFSGEGRKTFNALEDVSLQVEAGESLGIIGRNGSGKSTLLKILAGVTLPSSGEVRVEGRVASLLELGAGFHPMLTGRENVYLNAGLLGMRHAAVEEVFDDIVAFSGIGEFIDQPVDTYSSGMYVRIAFAVAVHANPDIFLVDEVLAVGDEEFQRQCRVKIGELKESGKTIVFVSHDLGIVNTLCDRVVLLDHGKMIARDSAQATIDFYLRQIGRESGIHTMRSERLEVIFSHGRIALFLDGKEVTAPSGWSSFLWSMGQHHDTSQAEWQVTETSTTSCKAVGTMARLPLSIHYDIRLDAQEIHLEAAITVERPVPLELLGSQLLLPTRYREWIFGEDDGVFPDITPADLAWSNIISPMLGADGCTILPDEDANLPPISLRYESQDFTLGQQGDNTDYMTGARAAVVRGYVPTEESPLQPGVYRLFNVSVNLGQDHSDAVRMLENKRAAATLLSGHLGMRVRGGQWTLDWNGETLSAWIHGHVQLKVQGLWCMSHVLHWSPPVREGDTLVATGESLRFGWRLRYEASGAQDGINMRVFVEADAPIDIEEYNVTLALRPAYSHWNTDNEQGAFPDFDAQQTEWRHLNEDYHPGTTISATGPGLPKIALVSEDSPRPMRMSPILTPPDQQSRILQAIAAPEQSNYFHFDAGRHLLFSGTIRAEATEG